MTEKLCKQDPTKMHTCRHTRAHTHVFTHAHKHTHTHGGFSLPVSAFTQLQLGVAPRVRRAVPCHVCVSLLSRVQHSSSCLMSVRREAEGAG